MLILQIESPSPYFQGDQVYRTFQPCFALAEHGEHVIAGTWLSPLVQQAALVADVLVICQAVWYDFLPVLQKRRRAGLCTLFEINDNFLALQHWNPAAGFYNDPSNRALTLQLAHDSDGLLLCSPGLVKRFSHLNKRVCVLPNQLWEVPHPAPRPVSKARPLTLGWAGSGGHREDIRWVAPVLCELLQTYPEVDLAIMGQEEVHTMFAAAPKARTRLLSPGSLSEYQAFLTTLDIGIAPLLPTEFNACRSDVKYLEYAAAGAVAVCSRAEPYAETVVPGVNGMLFEGPASLRAALVQLIEDAPLRARLAETALHDVQTRRQERARARERLDFYRSCLPKGAHAEMPGPSERVQALFRAHPTPAYRPHRSFWQLRPDHAEACLLDLTMTDEADEKALYEKMSRAVLLAPGAYLPHVYYGRHHKSYGKGVTALKKAMALNPASCLAPFLLGQVHLRVGAAQPALEAFGATVALAPGFAPAHEALARLSLDADQPEAAKAHLRAALTANPFYRAPALHLARMLLAEPDGAGAAEAEALLQESVAHGDAGWLDYFVLADALQRRRAWAEACKALESARALAPEQDVIRARLAQLYLLQGHPQLARKALKPPTGTGPATGPALG